MYNKSTMNMKRVACLFGLLGVMAISCVKEQQTDTPLFSDEEVFYATIDGSRDPETRVYANEGLRGRWDAGDRISIFNKSTANREYVFQGQTGDNSGEFKKQEGDSFFAGNPLDHVYAVYPYSESTSISDEGVITLSLPAEQSYRENTYGLGANTMIAVTDEDDLMFKNLCGYFAVKLYGDNVSVSSLTLKGNNKELLAGEATVVATAEEAPSLTLRDETATREITLSFDSPVMLGTTAETATSFWIVVPPTTFSKGITLTVMDNSGRVFVKSTTGELEIRRNTLKHSAALQVEPLPMPEAVDLGLSVKWASFNLGAASQEEYGYYFAWGETAPKASYSWSTYKWSNKNGTKFTKYCPVDKTDYWGGTGNPDGKSVLDLEDDAARANLGGNWRMPSDAEWKELQSKCTWTWTTMNGVDGQKVTSKVSGYTDKWIFIPASGYRSGSSTYSVGSYVHMWSSSLYTANPQYALVLRFSPNSIERSYTQRYEGQTIRPVSDERTHPASVALDKSSVVLYVGRSEQLIATVLPVNAIDKTVTWSSSNTNVATVDTDGHVTAVSVGSATITATTNDGNLTATCKIMVTETPGPDPEAVNLGLSVKWASVNLGATSPEGYGDYYAWGETEPKSTYSWSTYKWSNSNGTQFTKYCPSGKTDYWGGTGNPDGKSVLDLEDDAARANLGGNWRMPTDAEWKELQSKCTWTWTTMNGVDGHKVTSKVSGYTDKWIFIPASGYRSGSSTYSVGSYVHMWSSSLYTANPQYALVLRFSPNSIERSYTQRYEGQTIRPVSE